MGFDCVLSDNRVLSFNTLHLNTLYKVLLADKEDDQNRYRHGQGYSHHLADLRGSHGRIQELKTYGYREFLGGIQVD